MRFLLVFTCLFLSLNSLLAKSLLTTSIEKPSWATNVFKVKIVEDYNSTSDFHFDVEAKFRNPPEPTKTGTMEINETFYYYVDEGFDGGDFTVDLYAKNGDSFYFDFYENEIPGGCEKTDGDFTVSLEYYSKLEVTPFGGYYCTSNDDDSEIPVTVEKDSPGESVATLDFSYHDSSGGSASIPIDEQTSKIDIDDVSHLSGKELSVTVDQVYFSNTSFRNLYIAKPPDLDISDPEIKCHGGEAEPITISGFPETDSNVTLRFDVIQYGKETSAAELDSTEFNDEYYYWIDQNTIVDSIEIEESSFELDPSGKNFSLVPGLYEINVFYLDGSANSFCPSDQMFPIKEPLPLELELNPQEVVESTGIHTKTPGGDGVVEIVATGGRDQATYGYKVDSEGFEDLDGDSQTVGGLVDGDEIVLKNSDGCPEEAEVSEEVNFTEPETLEISDTTPSVPTCSDEDQIKDGSNYHSNGEIEYTIEGGVGEYTVKLYKKNSDGDYKDTGKTPSCNDNKFSNLENGIYKLKVNDDVGNNDSVNDIDLNQNSIDAILKDSNPSVCYGENYTVELAGDNSLSSYHLTYKEKDSSKFNSLKDEGYKLAAGDYDIKIEKSENNKCYRTYNLNVQQPESALTIEKSKTDSSPDTCKLENGSLTFEVSGGWSAENYEVTLSGSELKNDRTDDIEDGEDGEDKTVSFYDLPSGTDYQVTVTNDGSCETTLDNITVEETNPLDDLTLSLIKKESCDNHNDAEISVNGWEEIKDDYDCTVAENSETINSSGNITGLTEGTIKSAQVAINETTGRKCSFIGSVDIEVMENPVSIDTINSVINSTSCSTASNGSISVRGQGGRGEYKYKIEGKDEFTQDSDFVGKSSESYKIYIQDAAGCENSHNFNVPAKENPININTINVTPASCSNASDGAISIENIQHESGDSVNFYWDNTLIDSLNSGDDLSFSGADSSGIAPKTYYVKLKDGNNCSYTDSIEVGHEGYQPNFSQTIVEKVACAGKTNGKVSFELEEGEADDFEYDVFEGPDFGDSPLKSGKVEEQDFFHIGGLSSHHYFVDVVDSKGCGDTLEVDLPVVENSLVISQKNIKPASCDEIGNGVLEVNAEGGYAIEGDRYIFSYEKTNFDSQEVISGSDTTNVWVLESLFQGDEIEFYVEDKYGCRVDGDFVTIDVKKDFTEIQDVLSTNPACTRDSTGKLVPEMQWTPSSVDYEYFLYTVDDSFNRTDTLSGPLREDNCQINALPAGNYELEVVDDDGCRDVYQGVNLKDPVPVSVDLDHNYVRVKDEETGYFELSISGGNQKYEIGWSPDPGDDIFSNVDTITTSSYRINRLPGGSYYVAVRDTANCPYFDGESWFTRKITIPEPDQALNFSRDTVIDVSCNKFSDGRVEIEAGGGWGPDYMYSLNGGEPQDSGVFDQLTAGDYSILVTDTAGVSDSLSLEVTQPDTLNVFVDEVRDATCPRYANGVVEATVLNGIKGEDGLRYFVENTTGSSEIYGEMYSDRSYQFERLPKGNYEIFVEDANGCIASKPFSIQEPDTAVITINNNYIRAKGDRTGKISATVQHGNGVFNYRWFFEDNDASFEEGNTRGHLELDSLGGGEYTLMVRDTAGCVYEEDEWMIRHIDIREPEKSLGFNVAKNRAVSCFGEDDGLLRLEPEGGWGDYLLRLGDGEFVSSRVFDGLEKNQYSISVKDSAGVVYSDSIFVTQPDPLQASVSSIDDVNCYNGKDGEINLEVSGGNLSYLVSLDGYEWQEGTSITGLKKGAYSAYVKDTMGCSRVLDSIMIDQPAEIVLTDSSIVKSRCGNNEGVIEAEYEGGVGDFSYQWFEFVSNDDAQQELRRMDDENRSNIDELYSGRYRSVVTDDHDCQRSFEYRVSDIADLTIDSIKTSGVVCAGDSNGSAEAFVSKGNPAYSFKWSDEVGTFDQEEAGDIPAGQHWLEVRDTKGCLVYRDFTIVTPEPLGYDTLSLKQPLCLGGEKGRIELEGKGGTPGYEYRWSDGASGTVREEVEPGAYAFTLIDSRDCRARFRLDMNWQRVLQPDIGPDTTICHYEVLTLDGGGYKSYQWSLGNDDVGSSRRIDADAPGQYCLRVRDEDQCLGVDTLSLDVSTLKIRELNTTAVSCANERDGRAEISVTSNGDNYTISWPDDSEENVWENLPGGNYRVKVDNPRGCFAARDFTIDEPDPLSLKTSLRHPLCHGVHDGQIQVSASGGNGSYSYSWQHGPGQSSLRGLDEGEYVLAVTDAKGCKLSDRYELNYLRSLQPDLGSDLDLCSEAMAYVTPGNFHAYNWSLDGDDIEGDSVLAVKGPGEYAVEVNDRDGCMAFDSIQVNGFMSDLTPNFLSSSTIPKGDTLMVVDVTTPKPSLLEWSFSGKYEIIDEGDYFCEVVFEDEGMHTATLNTSLDLCMGMSRKQILVTSENDQNNPESTDKGSGSSLFNSMIVAPNPTEGAFTVELEMKKTATVNLYLVRIETGQVYEQKQLSGLDYYHQSFNVSGSGRYVLFAECTGDRLMRKVLVR